MSSKGEWHRTQAVAQELKELALVRGAHAPGKSAFRDECVNDLRHTAGCRAYAFRPHADDRTSGFGLRSAWSDTMSRCQGSQSSSSCSTNTSDDC